MRVLLFNPSWGGKVHAQRYNRCWPPLDLLNAASILRSAGFETAFRDARASIVTPEEFSEDVRLADRVLISTSPLDRWQCPNIDLKPLLSWTQLAPPGKLILCGVHGTLFPEDMLKSTDARVVIRGEPEATVLTLFRALAAGEEHLSEVPSISYFENDGIRRNASAPPCDLTTLPIPAYDLVDPDRYEYELMGRRMAVLETARGCPYRCTYCLKTMYGGSVRFKTPDQVEREVEEIVRLGYRHIYFIDLEFTVDGRRSLEICRIMKRFPVEWCCQTRVDAVDPELLKEMASSGCRLIHYGLESGEAETLHRIGKGISEEQMERAVRWTKAASIATAGFFLLGFPWETSRAWMETERLARRLNLTYASFHFPTAYAGTEFGAPWWKRNGVAPPLRPSLPRTYMRYCLRPAYVKEFLRNGRNPLAAMELLFNFLRSAACSSQDKAPRPQSGDNALMPARTDLTILIPLYNEEADLTPNLIRLMKFLDAHGLSAEILLGSNGSTDGTVILGKLMEEAMPEKIRFFHLEERGAVGEVFKIAAQTAASPLLVSLDADLSVDLEFIPAALSLLRENDVVIGSKRSGSQSRSPLRRFGSEAFIRCAQTLLKLPYDDYSIGTKAYRLRKISPWLDRLSADTNYVLDLVHHCHGAALPIAVLPVACEDWRTSRFNLSWEALIRFSHLFALWIRSLFRIRRPAVSTSPCGAGKESPPSAYSESGPEDSTHPRT